MKSKRTGKMLSLILCVAMMLALLAGCMMNRTEISFNSDGSGLVGTNVLYSENFMKNKAGKNPAEYFGCNSDELISETYKNITYYDKFSNTATDSFSDLQALADAGITNLVDLKSGTDSNGDYVTLTFKIPSGAAAQEENEDSADLISEYADEFVFAYSIHFPRGFARVSADQYVFFWDADTDTLYIPYAEKENTIQVTGYLTRNAHPIGAIDITLENEPEAGKKVSDVKIDQLYLFEPYGADSDVPYKTSLYVYRVVGGKDITNGFTNTDVELLKPEYEFKEGETYLVEVEVNGAEFNLTFDQLSSARINEEPCVRCINEGNIYTMRRVFAASESSKPAHPFSDVPKGAYYEDAVIWAFNHEPQITDGMSATIFGTDKTCTRGQVVTFLWRAAGCPEPKSTNNPFKDVKATDYFYKPVLWAVENGITDGTAPDKFSPANPCTYGHIITFIHRAMGCPTPVDPNEGLDVPQSVRDGFGMHLMGAENAAEQFPDWTRDAFVWAEVEGVLSGTYSNTYAEFPIKAPCPRKNVVYYLWKIDELRK